jgi:YhcG PDDEXK nuclease domain/EcoEI R protein C-terminal
MTRIKKLDLIGQLQAFLLELGKGFSFVARQKHITLEGEHFYVDLVFYNYLLKCFVLIDLKLGKLTHQDIGQMDTYVVTIPMLETARKRLRDLIRLIDKGQRKIIYTNFIDELGSETEIAIQAFGQSDEFDRFRAKARQFLLAHENQQTSQGLGLFIRSLVGLDREAAKQAFGDFLSASTASANQIEFINLIIDHLTHHGIMDPGLLYESPFTDINAQGLEGVFSQPQVDSLVIVLEQIRTAATAIFAA